MADKRPIYDTGWFVLNVPDPPRACHRIDLMTFKYKQDDVVAWEVPDLYEYYYEFARSLKVSREVTFDETDRMALAAQLGLELEGISGFFPSRRQVEAISGAVGIFHRDRITATTKGLLLQLLMWAGRARGERKLRALRLLQAWIQAISAELAGIWKAGTEWMSTPKGVARRRRDFQLCM